MVFDVRSPRAGVALGLLLAAACAAPLAYAADADDDDDGPAKPMTELIVTAKRLDAARANVDPDIGASTYALSAEMVESRPGSESTSINAILLQAPGVMQDGSGQLRVRQSHGDLQYRINGVILPEGVSDLGESISVRVAQSVQLTTGALPAQYGFQAGGVVNVTTKNGAYLDGGQVEVYGGSRGEIEPAFEYGSNIGPTNMFFSGSYHERGVGMASPDGSSSPQHDRSAEIDGFAFLDHILNDSARISLIAGWGDDRFDVPNVRGLTSNTAASAAAFAGPLSVNGVSNVASELLDDRKRDATRYVVGSYLHTGEQLTLQASAYFRDSLESLRYDGIADILFKGAAVTSDETDNATGVQLEAADRLSEQHTLRGGFVGSRSWRDSAAGLTVLPADAQGVQTAQTPMTIPETGKVTARRDSVFLQDEWKPLAGFTLNIGARYDDVKTSVADDAISPRLNAVWNATDSVVVHAGYARYFIPAPLDAAVDAQALLGTTGAPPSAHSDPLRAESDDYYDAGAQWTIDELVLSVDGYWRKARNFIAEGEFGLANLAQSYNYAHADIHGVELSGTYAEGPVTAWANLALAQGRGREIVSNQAYFTGPQLAALAQRFTALSQDETYTASGGASYRWDAFRAIVDGTFGSGLPRTLSGATPNADHLPGYAQINLALRYTLATWDGKPLELRLDVINLADSRYRLRDGTGLGDGMPQWGPARGVFFGAEQTF